MKKNLYNIYNVCRAYIMTFSMNAIKNNIQPLPEGKNADENNRSYLDALQKKKNCSIFKHSYIIKYRQS